jgi:hypothetical protein
MAWRQKTDPLYRGDAADAVLIPVPGADASIVRHILYLDGYGRETPYLSTSERKDVAAIFGVRGGIWKTTAPLAVKHGVGHLDNKQLLTLLKGKGKGKAKWPNAYEVLQAKRYAEQHFEHLLDFTDIGPDHVAGVVVNVFSKA